METKIIVNSKAFRKFIEKGIIENSNSIKITNSEVILSSGERFYINKSDFEITTRFDIARWQRLVTILRMVQEQPISLKIGEDGVLILRCLEI